MKNLLVLFLTATFLINCRSVPVEPPKTAAIESSYLSGYKKMSFHDEQRNKALEVSVWYPVAEGSAWKALKSPYAWDRIAEEAVLKNPASKNPLIVLSHGFSGSPEEFGWLVLPLVQAGYVVLATKHADLPGPQVNHWNRSLDVSFMLTEFLKTPLGKSIDEKKIGFAGFSLGGMTGISLAGARMQKLEAIVPDERHVNEKRISEDARAALPTFDRNQASKDYHDSRIKAAFLMAPAWSWVFQENDVKNIHIPVYIVSGDKDEVLVPATNGLWYANQISGAQFQWIKGAGHFIFLGAPTCEGRVSMDPTGTASFLYKDAEGVNRTLVQRQVEKLAISFFDAKL